METSSLRLAATLNRSLRQLTAATLSGLLLLSQTAAPQTAASPVSSVATTTQQATTSLPTLSNGEHQLKGGETQSFRIHLTAGQFFYALIEQLDIDVVAASYGPDGKQVGETDSPNDRWGFESILLVAETSGDYRVEVRSTNSKASAGRYRIKIMALREATVIDRDHAAAERAFGEGRKLRAQPTATAKRAAIDKYLSAAPLFKNAGDTYRQALTLLSTGNAYAQLNEFRRALPYFDETVALARSLGDLRLEAGTETFLGGMRDILGDIGPALDHYHRALQLSRDTGTRLTEANSLNNIGKIYNDLADWQKALEYYGQALTIYRAINSQQREAIALNNIGATYSLSGEPEKAIEYFQQSLPLLRAGTDRNAESYTISNIGNAYNRLGKHQTGLDYFAQARAIQQQTGNRAQEAETLDLAGIAYSALGQPAKALEYHQQAFEIQGTTGNLRRKALSLSNLGHVYNLLHQPDKALVQLDQALSLLRAIGDLNGIAVTLERSARAEQSRGNIDEARKRIEESLDLIETVRARSGSQQLRASYFASREQAYEFYIDLLMQQHAKDTSQGYDAQALRTVERGRARSLIEMLAETTVDIRQGVDPKLIEREHNLAQLLNAKAQRQIQLLAQKGSTQEIDILKRDISALENEFHQVQILIRKNSPQYASLTQPQTLTLDEIQQQLDGKTLLLEYSLGEERSFVWAVTPTSLKSYELPGRERIEISARRVYELLTARGITKPGETLTEKSSRLAKLDSQFVDATSELSQMVLGPLAAELDRKRLLIVADGALQYVPFAALPAVGAPPSVASAELSADKGQARSTAQPTTVRSYQAAATYRPLVIDHEIVSLPSASALAVQRKTLAGRKPAAKALAVIADPVFSTVDERFKSSAGTSGRGLESSDDSTMRIIEHIAVGESGKLAIRRLRFTRQEAYQILAVAPRATNLKALDFDASRATATATDLSQYRYVHFATHGYLDSERPDLSAIVLSLVDRQGNPQDGFLRAHDIYNLNLPAELVVLSACQTGLGKEIKGEGLVGLTRGFMYAGARRVVVSLWNVNDKATAELMRRFYRGVLKENLTPPAALRRAQAEMSQQKQWQSPYYWAAFVLQGEWR
ncbi:MAG: CHAT domain-containing protein [Acidobacteriota bacterium]|nr:CHAT domain-containing protein [Acidobacteriota bacterium]